MSKKRNWDPKKDDGHLTKRIVVILQEIFKRADKDGDGVLNEAELNAYAISCNGKPFDPETLSDIRENLPLQGFLGMYELQTFSDPNETWKDILSNGYDVQLNRRPDLIAVPAAGSAVAAPVVTVPASSTDPPPAAASKEQQ